MIQSSIFEWRQGAGWLVLSSGGRFMDGETEAIDTRMLSRSAADGALVYIGAADEPETAEQFLMYLGDLGSRSGYAIDIIAEDDASLKAHLGEAGIIVIGDGPQHARLYNGLQGAALEGILRAYENGALIMGIGFGAELFGQWILRPSPLAPYSGFTWLANAAILTGVPELAQKRTLQDLLHKRPVTYGLNIRPGSALTFGPDGQVELWGTEQIIISLGQAYSIRE
ncbi:MAG: type 1 glutamine amidotransferase-like domain-containing protein [Anaerolineae bacterium]|nr:type 1 glutamine amidotransferase-like domain-containing protein [Anaerolineae bacterium]